MSVSVLFFASLRELAGIETTKIEFSGKVKELIVVIGETLGDDLAAALSAENVRVAVNQTIVDCESELRGGDEVAFLPPVTGG